MVVYLCWASQVALLVKSPPANAGDEEVKEDPLEEGMATHSSILAWRIPWTEEPVLRGLAQAVAQRLAVSVGTWTGHKERWRELWLSVLRSSDL